MYSITSVTSNCLQPKDHSLPGSSVHGIFQARILEWVAMPTPGDLSDPEIKPVSPRSKADSLPTEPLRKPILECSQLTML